MNEIKKPVGEKIEEARELLGLSQRQLGEMVGVSARTIYSYEIKGAKPRPSTLRKLANTLKVSTEYLERDDIDDPLYGMERKEDMDAVREKYGNKTARELDFLLEKNLALFAGGTVSQSAKDEFFQAVMQAYVLSKDRAKEKFGHRKTDVPDA
ncbi:MAG: helix-turn-helix domain-containing protein [Tannerella sp.]|jgi:transcriptional regulator with XRE-family HTH domain|nr:helix-turn-helix domain-containing protein [Tannerella sp.]